MRTFPVTDYPSEGLRWRPLFANLSGGPTVAGPGQVGEVSGGGWWVAESDGIDLGEDGEIRAWMALMFSGAQTVEAFVVPMKTWPVNPDAPVTATIAAHALRATTVEITTDDTIGVGHCFTLAHAGVGPRVHMILGVDSHVGDVWTVHIGPPLREATTAAMAVDFDNPRCVMRISNPTADAWPRMGAGWSSKVQVTFEEAFDELPVE